jgi:hypothetical protein
VIFTSGSSMMAVCLRDGIKAGSNSSLSHSQSHSDSPRGTQGMSASGSANVNESGADSTQGARCIRRVLSGGVFCRAADTWVHALSAFGMMLNVVATRRFRRGAGRFRAAGLPSRRIRRRDVRAGSHNDESAYYAASESSKWVNTVRRGGGTSNIEH